jgi:hypothetical protein
LIFASVEDRWFPIMLADIDGMIWTAALETSEEEGHG